MRRPRCTACNRVAARTRHPASHHTNRPFDRSTGKGYVAARDGDYRDALTKKHPTLLLLVETTGAMSPSLTRLIAGLARESREKSAIDHTAYGLERCSPKEFAAHHTAAISAAIQLADVLTLRNAASSLQFSVSYM